MGPLNEVGEFLQTYGGWGVSVICLGIIWRMAKYIRELHEQQREDDKAAAKAQREETTATVTVIVEVRDAMRALTAGIEALTKRLEKLEG